MFRRTLCVTVLSLVVALTEGEDTILNACQTPKGQAGVCVLIRSCPPLLQLLYPGRRTTENIQYITSSHCGYSGKSSVVCCPLKPSEPTANPTPSTGGGATPKKPPPKEVAEPLVDVSASPRLKLLPLSICGADSGEKLFGGQEVSLMEYPWMALLGDEISRTRSVFPCAGTVISNRYVLTAAHCVTSSIFQRPTLVRLGELNLRNKTDCAMRGRQEICAPPVEDYAIEEIVVHPNYSRPVEFDNDIALLRLNQTITFKDHIRPICLPIGDEQRRQFKAVDTVIVAGWGLTEEGYSSPALLKAFLPIVPHEKCAESYSQTRYRISAARHLCAGGDGKSDACSGDSGGPFKTFGEVPDLEEVPEGGVPGTVQRVVQYGIVSFGPKKCANINTPGIYTRVGFFMDWILNSMKE